MRCFALAVLAAAVLATSAWAVDGQSGTERQTTTEGKTDRLSVYKTSDVLGMHVRNQQGENLGKIEDLVVDLKSGQIRYAALSFGGVLGIGDKLFAVPWQSLSLQKSLDSDDHDLTLNVSKDALENAPGFAKDNWPDVANPQWASQIDRHYQAQQERDVRTR